MVQLFRWIPVAIITVLTIAILWTTIAYNRSSIEIGNSDTRSTLDYISANAKQLPINQVYIDRTSCPSGTQPYVIGKFAGLENNADGNLDPRDLTVWGKKYYLCVRRNSDAKWLDENSQSCPGGYKQCTVNTCVPTAEDCPYIELIAHRGTRPSDGSTRLSKLAKHSEKSLRTHVRLAPNDEQKRRFPTISQGQEVEPDAKAYYDPSDNFKMLTFRRGQGATTGNVIVDLNITIDGPPCVVPDRYYARSSSFPAERVQRNGCGDYGPDGSGWNSADDAFSSSLDEQSEAATYKANGILLPSYFQNFLGDSHRARLSIKRKIRSNSINQCAKVSSTNLINVNQSYNNFYTSIKTVYVILYVILGAAIIMIVFVLLIKPVRPARAVVYTLCGLLVLLGICMLIPSIIYSSNRDKPSDDLQALGNCSPRTPFSKATDQINNDLANTQSDLSTQTQILLWLGILSILSGPLFAFVLYRSVRRAQYKFMTESMGLSGGSR